MTKQRNKNHSSAGFTLIELLVVISIISMLASTILIATNNARNSAKLAKAKTDLVQLAKQVEIARDQQNMVMHDITNSWYTAGGPTYTECVSPKDLRNLAAGDVCFDYNTTQWQKMGLSAAPRDPWGSLYTMDEEEAQNGTCIGNVFDRVLSVGPDGILGSADDLSQRISNFRC